MKLFSEDISKRELLNSAQKTLERIVLKANFQLNQYPVEMAKLLLSRIYIFKGNVDEAKKIYENWTPQTTKTIQTALVVDRQEIEEYQNDEDLDTLQLYILESFDRLSFEYTDLDIVNL